MSLPQAVDWRKCIICRRKQLKKTQRPANSKRYYRGAGYITIELDFTSFHEADELHLADDCKHLDEENGIATFDLLLTSYAI